MRFWGGAFSTVNRGLKIEKSCKGLHIVLILCLHCLEVLLYCVCMWDTEGEEACLKYWIYCVWPLTYKLICQSKLRHIRSCSRAACWITIQIRSHPTLDPFFEDHTESKCLSSFVFVLSQGSIAQRFTHKWPKTWPGNVHCCTWFANILCFTGLVGFDVALRQDSTGFTAR